MAEQSMVERVARAFVEHLRGDGAVVWEEDIAAARAAIEAMRNLPMEAQMAGCEAQSAKSIELDGPLKKHEDCKEPDDWMQRGHGMAKRMMSGQEFMAGWNGAIDAALKETA